jgi:rod shape-determining protein MreB
LILDNFMSWFSNDLGIDLGTCNTLVCVRGEGIVLNEPTVVAVRKGTNEVMRMSDGSLAVGWTAKEMLGKTPGSISAIRPLKEGVISDYQITQALLEYFITKAQGRRHIFFGPRVVIAVPSGITIVEKHAVRDSAERAGARKVVLVPEPRLAAMGANLPITEATASMIVDIGGGTTEVAILSLADIAYSESVRVAGDNFDEAIIIHMRKAYNLMIGEQTAERIKIEIGSAFAIGPEQTMEVRGRDMISGLPRKTIITSEEVRQCFQEPILVIAEAVKATLEKAAPELAADLVDNGITLAGGGALLRGIDKVISNSTGLDVRCAEDPLTCVARGTAMYIEAFEEWSHLMDEEDNDG